MGVIALLHAEFKRLEEELKHSQGMKKWDERNPPIIYLTLFF